MRRKGFTELVDFARAVLGYSQAEAETYARVRLEGERAKSPPEGQLELREPDPHDPATSPWPKGF